jgi:hypothetical protein
MDFKNLTPREVKTKSVVVKIEIELIDSSLQMDDILFRVQSYLNHHNSGGISFLVLYLLRAAKARFWNLKNIEVNEND